MCIKLCVCSFSMLARLIITIIDDEPLFAGSLRGQCLQQKHVLGQLQSLVDLCRQEFQVSNEGNQ